jgi:hypothetical protein
MRGARRRAVVCARMAECAGGGGESEIALLKTDAWPTFAPHRSEINTFHVLMPREHCHFFPLRPSPAPRDTLLIRELLG